jgi:hypothetical protein
MFFFSARCNEGTPAVGLVARVFIGGSLIVPLGAPKNDLRPLSEGGMESS